MAQAPFAEPGSGGRGPARASPGGWGPWPALSVLSLLVAISARVARSSEAGIRYRVKIEGLEERALRKAVRRSLRSNELRKQRPPTFRMLERRAERDLPRITKILRSEGYYAGTASVEVRPGERSATVEFKVVPGVPYVLRSVAFEFSLPLDTEARPLPDEVGLRAGEPAKAASIIEAGERLIRWLKVRGYPFPTLADRQVVVDHADHTVSVVYRLDPGRSGRLGAATVIGCETVREDYVRRKLRWNAGDRFDLSRLEESHDRLAETGLFAGIRITEEGAPDEQGNLPVMIQLTERKHRTVRTGIDYKTDEGWGTKVSWEHRNLFGEGERLRFEAAVAEVGVSGEGLYRQPDFFRDDQALFLKVRAAEDDPPAYTSRSIRSVALIERKLSRHLLVQAGPGVTVSEVNQFGEKREFGLLSFPMGLTWDTSDDLLDPTRGGRLDVEAAPVRDTFGSEVTFLRSTLGYRRYQPLLSSPRVSLAGKARLGSIAGASQMDVPADERFYAGGGGSIRGYSYQSVGPLSGGDPVGGRSLLELSTELRLRLGERFGFVGFLDGGSAFGAAFPDFDEELLWGTGLGFRYFTAVGPLRLDFAVPLDRRHGIDDAFQVYISLGQAF